MKNKSNMLINEPPLMVLPSLAAEIGLNEAIVMQQLHYWINNQLNAGIEHDGQKWIYNTYEEWQIKNFPFWSVRTIQRIFIRLEEMGLIKTKQLNSGNYDRTKYYTIDYDEVNKLDADRIGQNVTNDEAKNGIIDSAKMAHSTYTETTTEINLINDPQPKNLSAEASPYLEVWESETGLPVMNPTDLIEASNTLARAGVTPEEYRQAIREQIAKGYQIKKPSSCVTWAVNLHIKANAKPPKKPDTMGDPEQLKREAQEMIRLARMKKPENDV